MAARPSMPARAQFQPARGALSPATAYVKHEEPIYEDADCGGCCMNHYTLLVLLVMQECQLN